MARRGREDQGVPAAPGRHHRAHRRLAGRGPALHLPRRQQYVRPVARPPLQEGRTGLSPAEQPPLRSTSLSPLRPRSAPSRLPRGLRSRGSVCGVRVPLTFQNFPCGVNRVGSGGRAEGPGAVGTCAYGRAGHAGARAALAGTEAVCLFPRRALLMHPEPPPAATSEGRLTRDM